MKILFMATGNNRNYYQSHVVLGIWEFMSDAVKQCKSGKYYDGYCVKRFELNNPDNIEIVWQSED